MHTLYVYTSAKFVLISSVGSDDELSVKLKDKISVYFVTSVFTLTVSTKQLHERENELIDTEINRMGQSFNVLTFF